MIDLAIARSDLVDEAAFGVLRAGVPPGRRERSDAYHRPRDRYASVVSFSLLQQLWRGRFAAPLPPVAVGRYGKPRFVGEEDWHFNLSHDAGVCVAVLGPVPVGVDVQGTVPFDDGLFDRMAAPGEQRLRERLRRSGDLSPLWTRKEAIVKRTGRGLTTPLRDVDTLASPSVLTFAHDDLGVRLSVSAEGLQPDALGSRLRVRRLAPVRVSGQWCEVPTRPLRHLPPPPPGAAPLAEDTRFEVYG